MPSALTRQRRQTSLTVSHSACLVAAALLNSLASSTPAQDTLPPLRQLIAETLTLANTDRENNSAALNDLAQAECYLGDFAAARKTLPPYGPQEFVQQAHHLACARIEIEITGSLDSIPRELWKSEIASLGFIHSDAALDFVNRGEIDKAMQHIAQFPKDVHSVFSLAAPELIGKLVKAGHKEEARQVLKDWAASYQNADSVFDYRQGAHTELLVALLVEYDLRDVAADFCRHERTVAQAETDVAECGESIARVWAQCGKSFAILGDKPSAQEALRQAHIWLDKARDLKLDLEMRIRLFDFAKAYAALAARQTIVLGTEEALTAYDRSYELARLTVTPEYGEYTFEQILVEQLAAGDESGARETLNRVLTPRSRAKCWHLLAKHSLEQGKDDPARAAARAAVQELDRDGFEPFMAQDMAPIAATAARAGENELAQKLFHRALALSEANEQPKFNHPWIAGIQAHAGFHSDAYRTIQTISQRSDRAQPLADLCLALAKAEYLATKKRPLEP